MKKLLMLVTLAILTMGVVSATTTTLADDSLVMDYIDQQTVTFCIFDTPVAQGPANVDVSVSPICRDLDGNGVCEVANDDYVHAGFSVVPDEPTTGADGCVNLTITTNNVVDGLYIYTVNGLATGTSTVYGSETGSVLVPEFGILAAIGVLGLAGLFIYRRRE